MGVEDFVGGHICYLDSLMYHKNVTTHQRNEIVPEQMDVILALFGRW